MNRKYASIVSAFICLMGMSFGQLAADEITTDVSKLPKPAAEFIANAYPKAKVAGIEIDEHLLKPADYEVILSDGTNIEFDSKGEWKEIKNKFNGVPVSVLPEAVSAYINAEYKGKKIKEVSKKAFGWEIDLVKGPELRFDKQGKFLGIDD